MCVCVREREVCAVPGECAVRICYGRRLRVCDSARERLTARREARAAHTSSGEVDGAARTRPRNMSYESCGAMLMVYHARAKQNLVDANILCLHVVPRPAHNISLSTTFIHSHITTSAHYSLPLTVVLCQEPALLLRQHQRRSSRQICLWISLLGKPPDARPQAASRHRSHAGSSRYCRGCPPELHPWRLPMRQVVAAARSHTRMTRRRTQRWAMSCNRCLPGRRPRRSARCDDRAASRYFSQFHDNDNVLLGHGHRGHASSSAGARPSISVPAFRSL